MEFEAFIEKEALDAAQAAIGKAAARKKEALGFLLGSAYTWKGRHYAVADEFITAPSASTAVSVRFERQAFAELARELRAKHGKIIVGWCHSHLNYGCFLSPTDIATQSKYFDEPHGFALNEAAISTEIPCWHGQNSRSIASVIPERFGEIQIFADRHSPVAKWRCQ